MSDDTAEGGHEGSYGLGRWLAGGLVAGAAGLGLLIGAYAIGYDRGERHAAAPVPAVTSTTAATTTTTTTTSGQETAEPVTVTPALIARGRTLFNADGCASCHSLSGAAGAGPPLDGLAGRSVTLADDSTVIADVPYLERSITDPDAQIVKGYQRGIMPAAVAPHDFAHNPADVLALAAFLEANK
jgi:mono/diheme cytochrome c family protein